jgi:AbrB family looped-hinge helix DNA binding protein
MSLTVQAFIGKKYAIYLPKAIVRALNLSEGERVLLRVAGNSLILEFLKDSIQLALSGKKFASITPKQVEKISLEKQADRIEASP